MPGLGLITNRFMLYGVAGAKIVVLPNVKLEVNSECGDVMFPKDSKDVKKEWFDVMLPNDRFDVNNEVIFPDEMLPKVKVEVNRDAYLVVMFPNVNEDANNDSAVVILPNVRDDVNIAVFAVSLPKDNDDVNKDEYAVVALPKDNEEVNSWEFPVVIFPKVRVDVNNDALPVVMLPNVRVEVKSGCHVFSCAGGASVVKQNQFETLCVPSFTKTFQ